MIGKEGKTDVEIIADARRAGSGEPLAVGMMDRGRQLLKGCSGRSIGEALPPI